MEQPMSVSDLARHLTPAICERRPARQHVARGLACMLAMLSLSAHAGLNSGPEYAALVNLFNSTNGASWTNGSSGTGVWALGTDACGWYGITCDQDTNPADNTSHVIAIILQSNNLTGPLQPIGAFTQLHDFQVRTNALTGSIPALTGLTHLTILDVGHNQLTVSIPAVTGTSIEFLEVNDNQLTGPLPSLSGVNPYAIY